MTTFLLALACSLSAVEGERYPLQHYLTAIAEKQWRQRDAQLANIKTPADVAARAEHVRAEFLQALGGLPAERTPLNARITGRIEREGYRIEKLIFESQPGFFVTANVFVPTTSAGPYPAILGAQGHSIEGRMYPTYQMAYIALALRGYLVLAYDPPGQGERFEGRDAGGKMELLGHFSPGLQCMLTGGNISRYFIWDGIRAVDYLLTRPDVDPKRIGVTGNSGGGTQSAFLAVLEPRIAVAAPSCYWTSWPALWAKAGPPDPEQVLHQTIMKGIDFSDVLTAFAPKPIIMLTATQDSFPIAGAHSTHAEGKTTYDLLNAGERLGYFEYDDKHGWSQPRREAGYAWFDKWFLGRADPAKEPVITTESIETLQCTPTGQVVTSLNGKTMQMLAQETADTLSATRRLAMITDAQKARTIIAARLEIPLERAGPTADSRGHETLGALRLEKIGLNPEPGISLAIEVIGPASPADTPRPVVIIVPEVEIAPAADWNQELEAWVRSGYTVVVAKLRGLLPPDKLGATGYTERYRIAMRTLMVGKTMSGMRVQDLLAVHDYLSARRDVNPQHISIIGHGAMGPVALYAAALEPKIKKAVACRAPLSFRDMVRAKAFPIPWVDVILPGVFHDFDLPDIATLAGPGRVALVNPVSLADPPAVVALARKEYGPTTQIISGVPKVTAGELE